MCIALTGEERHELMGAVAPLNVEGEKTAVFATDVVGQTLQLFPVIFPGREVAAYGRLHRFHKRYSAVGMELEYD